MLSRIIQGDCMLFYDGDALILTVKETDTENGVLMQFSGSLRSDTAYHIQDELDAFTSIAGPVTLDLAEVTFLAPSVLAALLESQQLIDYFRQGRILLRNIPDSVYREMDETGISELLMIEE